jgi:hypothetical protein
MFSNFFFFFFKSYRLRNSAEKVCTAGQATRDNMTHAHCVLGTQGYKRILRICNIYRFPTSKWLHECASMSRYPYIICLVLRGSEDKQ